jgi:hypothetical protein
MKHFPIRKSKTRRFPFMPEGTLVRLPRPKIPLIMFWKADKTAARNPDPS